MNTDILNFLEAIRGPWEQIRKEYAERNEKTAADFNIFAALGVERRELSHSSFLAELLNPNGSHGQGDTFLRGFLSECESDKQNFPKLPDTSDINKWSVDVEVPYQDGRIDILLKYCATSNENSVLIAIENKIGASLASGQLEKYWKCLESQRSKYAHRALIYLTIQGQRATEMPDKDIPCTSLSYTKNIANAMSIALKSVDAPVLTDTLMRYKEIIHGLEGRYRMPKGVDKELMSYLKEKPERLTLALEVSDCVSLIREEILADFWDKIQKTINKRLREQSLDKTWTLTLREKCPGVTDNWHGYNLTDGVVTSANPQVAFSLSLNNQTGRFYYGVTRDASLRDCQAIPPLLELPEGLHSENEYIGYQTIRCRITNLKELILFAGKPENVEDLTDDIWQLFLTVKDKISNANNALRAARQED